MGIEEKAKTFDDFTDEYVKLCHSRAGWDVRARFKQQRLVLVSVAQQEIDKEKEIYHVLWEKYDNLNEMFQSLMKLACDYYDDVKEERGLQKQKLDKLIDELKHRPSQKGASYSTYQEGWLDGMALAIHKFEELLK